MPKSRYNYCVLIYLISTWYVVLSTGWSITSLGLMGNNNPNCYVAPKICPNKNITFHLYTSDNPTTPILLDETDEASIAQAPFLIGKPFKFLFHGYTGYLDYTPNMELRPAYFQNGRQINVISIDYGNLVKEGCYPHAVDNIDLVGKCTAQFLEKLGAIRRDISICSIHLIGFSLGAHVTGQVANHFTQCKFERITALDSAGPLFQSGIVDDDRFINSGDALFIDTLHTSSDKGKFLPYGDADFYANNAAQQPGCRKNSSCNHARAVEYYAASINSKIGFRARRCNFFTYFLGFCYGDNPDTYEFFGEYVNPEARGTYFFNTHDKPPFEIPPEEENN